MLLTFVNRTNTKSTSGSSVATSPTGWTDNELAVRWVEEVFIPFALKNRVSDSSAPILLIYDGHDSHETAELQRTVYAVNDCNIIIFCFPSKCTHKLQPLDVAVFNHVERVWGTHCSQRLHEGVAMNRYNIIQEYMAVRSHALTPNVIKSGFEKTGLFPVNRHVFTDLDFAPSRSLSTQPHVPDTYPLDIPSSDPPQIPSDVESDFESDSDTEGAVAAHQQGDNQPPPPAVITIDDLIADSEDEVDDEDFVLPDHSSHNEMLETCTEENTMTSAGPRTRSSPTHFDLEGLDLNKILGSHVNVPVSVDQAKSQDDLFADVRNLCDIIRTLCETTHNQAAQIEASNAHCTIMKRKLQAKQTELYNFKKKKERGSTKVKARFITLPGLKAAFYAEEAVRQEKEHQATQKVVQREVEEASLEAHIVKEAATRVFTNALSSYKTKADLRILARALHLNDDGTNPSLIERIQKYLNANTALLKQDPRFSGLFGSTRRRSGQPQLGGPPHPGPTLNISENSLSDHITAPPTYPSTSTPAPPLMFQPSYQSLGYQYSQYSLPGSSTSQIAYSDPQLWSYSNVL